MSQDPYSNQPVGPPPSYQQGGSDKKGLAISALVVGILSLPAIFTVIGGILLGLVAVVLGFIAMRGARKGTNGGKGMAITGLVLGLVGLVVSIGIVVVGVLFLNSDSGQQLQDCLSQAGDDQAAAEQCQRDFADDLAN